MVWIWRASILLAIIFSFGEHVTSRDFEVLGKQEGCYSAPIDLAIVAQHTEDMDVGDLQRRSFIHLLHLFLGDGEDKLSRLKVALIALKIKRANESYPGNVNKYEGITGQVVFDFTEYDNVTEAKIALEMRSLNDTRGTEFEIDQLGNYMKYYQINGTREEARVVMVTMLYNLSDAHDVCHHIVKNFVNNNLGKNQLLVVTDTAIGFMMSHPQLQIRHVTDDLMALQIMDDFLCPICNTSQWRSPDGKTCYELLKVSNVMSWMKAETVCPNGGSLSSIETEEEYGHVVSGLKDIVEWDMMDKYNDDHSRWPPSDVFIHLKRKKDSLAKHFTWEGSKPLVFNKWLPEKQSRCQVRDDCAVLTFKQRDFPPTMVIPQMYTEIGWRQMGCGVLLGNNSHVLCEWQLKEHTKEPLKLTPVAGDRLLSDDVMSRGNYGRLEASQNGSLYLTHYLPTLKLVCGVLECGKSKYRDHDHLSNFREHVQESYLDFSASKWSNHPAVMTANDVTKLDPSHVMFRCEDSWIPYSEVCDHKVNCQDGSDESLCGALAEDAELSVCDPVKEHRCDNGRCVAKDAVCDLYDDCQDGRGSDEYNCDCKFWKCASYECVPFHYHGQDCILFSEEMNNITTRLFGTKISYFRHKNICEMVCERGQCIEHGNRGDGKNDCNGPEGHIDETWGRLEPAINCGRYTHTRIWSPRCVLLRDRFKEIIGCRSMKHLEGCADFVCPDGYVKCPNSYCIPVQALKDSIVDCPQAEDEDPFEHGFYQPHETIEMFVCDFHTNFRYLHPDFVCDGLAHCTDKSDEQDCGVTCTDGFLCLGDAVVTSGYDFSNTLTNLSFIDQRVRFLNLSHVTVPTFFEDYPDGHMRHLLYLILAECSIDSIEKTKDKKGSRVVEVDFITVVKFDLSGNLLRTIGNNSILSNMRELVSLNLSRNTLLTSIELASDDVPHLEELDLSHCAISHLDKDFFLNKNVLKKVSLHNTRIVQIQTKFPASLQSLDLRIPTLRTIEKSSLKHVKDVQMIQTPSYRFCCPQILGPTIKAHTCTAPTDTLSSCADLLREPVLRVLLWLVGLAALLGNFVVILYRLLMERKEQQTSFKKFVAQLSVSDILMGVYLIIIAAMDMQYQGEYVLHEREWRSSVLCRIAGFLSTLSSETSAMFIFLITADRFLVTKFPLGQFRFTKVTIRISCCIAWLVGFLLALLPLLPPLEHWVIYSINGMCLGLPLSVLRLPGWQFSVAVFVGFNFLLFLLIALGQIAIYRSFSGHNQSLGSSKQLARRKQEITIAKRLSVIVVSDFFCWFPIGIMGLLALAGYEIGDEAYTWSAVVVLPINSALNPLLYTMGAVREKWDKWQETKSGRKQKTGDTSIRSKSSTRTSID